MISSGIATVFFAIAIALVAYTAFRNQARIKKLEDELIHSIDLNERLMIMIGEANHDMKFVMKKLESLIKE